MVPESDHTRPFPVIRPSGAERPVKTLGQSVLVLGPIDGQTNVVAVDVAGDVPIKVDETRSAARGSTAGDGRAGLLQVHILSTVGIHDLESPVPGDITLAALGSTWKVARSVMAMKRIEYISTRIDAVRAVGITSFIELIRYW